MSADPAARPPRLPVPVVLPPARRPATPPGLALPPVLPAPPATEPRGSESPAAPPGQRAPHVTWWAWALAAATVVGHVAVNRASPYGVHRDELLYLAMGEHLQLWRMDFPPFMALAAELTRALVGDARVAGSVAALRLGPALAAGALVLLAALLAREFGGRRGPQFLAAGAVACSPMFLRTGTLFQPVVFDQLWWTLGFLALVRLGRHADEGARPWAPRRLTPASLEIVPGDRAVDRRASDVPRRWWRARDARDWLVLGAAGGLGLLTKFSIAFFAAGVLAGVLATPLRRRLRTPGPWAAAALALALGAPSVVGQLRLGWPVAGQMAHLQATQLARVGPAGFFLDQLPHGPGLLLALLGLVALLASFRLPEPAALASLRAGRAAGVAALTAVLLLAVGRGKGYYAGPVYPLLWAAGAAALGTRRWGLHPESRRAHLGARLRLAAAGVLVAAYGALTLPLGLPILPPEPMARYAAWLGVGTETNTGGRLALPQDYADMLGWPELAGAVADAWRRLPPEARESAAIVAGNYGEAGALALYGPRLDLPAPVSPAGSFWFFGPGERVGDPILAVGIPAADLAPACGAVRPLGVVRHARTRWLVPEEQDVPMVLCERPRRTLHELWPSLVGKN